MELSGATYKLSGATYKHRGAALGWALDVNNYKPGGARFEVINLEVPPWWALDVYKLAPLSYKLAPLSYNLAPLSYKIWT